MSEAQPLTRSRSLFAPLVRALRGAGVSPNAVSVFGVALVLVGSALVGAAQPAAAALALVAGALADSVDGELARLAGRATPFGAFLDSTLDRVGDAAMYAGAIAFALRGANEMLGLTALWALVASFLVSYVRAKAESLDTTASVGVAPRQWRTAILIAGVAAWAASGEPGVFTGAVALTAILATVTVAQRIAHVARQLSPRA